MNKNDYIKNQIKEFYKDKHKKKIQHIKIL